MSILAYFDPGSGSLLVQVIAGGLAGVTVFGKYLWDAFLLRRHTAQDSQADLEFAGKSSVEISITP